MGTVYARGDIWWIGFADAAGKWHYRSAKTRVRAEAEQVLRDVSDAIDKGRIIDAGPKTFEAYATAACAERGGRRDEERVWTAGQELGRLREHVFPVLGSKRLSDVRPRDIRGLVKELKAKRSRVTGQRLAARTVRNIYGIVRTLFSDAVADELLEVSPCVLKSGDMPTIVDKDPEWRDDAEFTRAEVEQLISDSRLPFNRRVWWALGFLSGMRTGEIAALRWRHYELGAPLGELKVLGSYNSVHKRVKSTKTNRPRRVPVHPSLASLLAAWRANGWQELNGRPPGPDDLVVTNERGGFLSDPNTKKTRPRDLKRLGLRVRRFHDARSTFITLGSMDGADEVWLERVTHNAKGSVFNQYRRGAWLKMCEAVGRLQIRDPLQGVLRKGGAAMEGGGNRPGIAVRSEGFEPLAGPQSYPRSAGSAGGSDPSGEASGAPNGADRRNVVKPAIAARVRELVRRYGGGGR